MPATVAQTIWGQISIGTKMAVAAREPVADGQNRLIFRVTTGKRGLSKMTIDLNGHDLYDIKLYRIRMGTLDRPLSVDVVGMATDVGAEQLSETIIDLCAR